MNNGKRFALKIAGAAAAGVIAIGGWCFALGQRSTDKEIVDRVYKVEMKQARWEERWDERWQRILEELKAIRQALNREIGEP